MKATTAPLPPRLPHHVCKSAAATRPTTTTKDSVGSGRSCCCHWLANNTTAPMRQSRQQQQQHSHHCGGGGCQQQKQQQQQEQNDEHCWALCRMHHARQRRRYAHMVIPPPPPPAAAASSRPHSASASRARALGIAMGDASLPAQAQWQTQSRQKTSTLALSTKTTTMTTTTDAHLCHTSGHHAHRTADEGAHCAEALRAATSVRLVDSIKLRLTLRKPQLVMPIGEKRQSTALSPTASRSDFWWWRPMLVVAAAVQQHAAIVDVAATAAEREQMTVGDSQTTTTLECTRCFKVNGDILSEPAARADAVAELLDTPAALQQCSWAATARIAAAPTGCAATTTPMTPVMAAATELPAKQRKWQPLQKCWQSLLSASATRSPWLLLVVMFVLTTSSTVDCWAGRQDVMSNCTFPVRWEGSWFLSGYQQSIHIKGSQFSYRGKCAASDGNKYLIVDEKGCHRCLVIYEKHKNVLQYKESECEGDSMYMHQSNPSAMAMHSVLKQNLNGGEHRGGAHPNTNNNGHSRLSSSDQYIMRSNDDMNDYFCKGRETLQNLCDQIPGDALLYSLFRENAEPVKCPLKGPFIFTYNRGHGECKNPVSNIESCTEDSRLLLSFQACHDVQGTESTVEELTCLAAWKDGNSRYLVGLVSHHHAISNEERYRCFVYEKINSMMGGPSIVSASDAEYKLAQSGDATCNGLDSAEVGSRIMSLRKPPITERCDFPVWFKGPRNWQALMGNAYYNYHSNDGSVHIFNSNGYMETRALCEQINKQTSTEMMAVVHYTTGCKSGFMCMMFYRRDTHVIEIQSGKQASRLEDACAQDHFDIHKTPYLTLLASNPDPQICPLEGLYSLRGAIGPPYQATRHKRNHNNNNSGNKAVHSGQHGHHHQSDGFVGGTVGVGMGNSLAHKRHSTLRFRNAEANERGAWPSNTRGLPVRSRRDAASTTIAPSNSSAGVSGGGGDGGGIVSSATPDAFATHKLLLAGSNVSDSTELAALSGQRRQRRNAPTCVTNFKAQRQLWVGCTEPNVIDVRPLCNEDGDEEYSCHGSWAENGTVYIIARHKGVNKHGVCVSYRPTDGTTAAAMLVVGDACYRGTQKPPDHHLVANLAVFGKCGETGSGAARIKSSISASSGLALLAVVVSTLLLLGHVQTALAGHRLVRNR